MVIQFGDVFRFREKEYVFLVATDEIVYTALILDEKLSKLVKNRYANVGIKDPEKSKNYAVYCFVELRTEQFRDRVAHFARSGKDETANVEDKHFDIIGRLNKEDLNQIKTEIAGGPVALELKRMVEKIEVG